MTYLKQLEVFMKHMSESYDTLLGDNCTEETVNEFYNSTFTITFQGVSVDICNGADAFQTIEELIKSEIDDVEEV